VVASWVRASMPRLPVKPRRTPSDKRTVPRLRRGRSEWKAMAGPRSPLRRSLNVSTAVSAGTRASLPLDAIRRPRDTPIWKLEASLKCRSCRKGRSAPPVRMIKLTEAREITPYKWVHPDEER
jgi:hypothetical protein